MAEITPLQGPAAALAQVGGAINAINQNRLFQGQLAAGRALQQATDPNTGQVDPLQYNRLLAMDPSAAPAMADAANASQVMQGQQQSLQNSRAGAMNAALSSVLALPDDQLHAGTSAALQRLVVQRVIPPFQAAAMSQRLDSLPDPTALRSQLGQIQLSMQPPSEQTGQIFGATENQSDGQTNFSGIRAPARAGGGFMPSSAMPIYPSRSDLLGLEPTQDSAGRPNVTTRGTLANRAGGGALTGPAGAQLPGAPQGQLPSALVPPGYTRDATHRSRRPVAMCPLGQHPASQMPQKLPLRPARNRAFNYNKRPIRPRPALACLAI